MVAETFEVEAFGIDGAVFSAEPDPETNFKLFGPVARAKTGVRQPCRAFALRLRPNQDFAGAWKPSAASMASRAQEFTAASAGPSARGSRTAAAMVPFATELLILRQRSRPAPAARSKLHSMSRWSTIPAALREGRLCVATIRC